MKKLIAAFICFPLLAYSQSTTGKKPSEYTDGTFNATSRITGFINGGGTGTMRNFTGDSVASYIKSYLESGNLAPQMVVTPSIYFEGTVADEYETLLNAANPTADNTIILPNRSGTVALLDDIAVVSDGVPFGMYAEFPTGVTPPAGYLATDGSNGTPTRTAASGFNGYVKGGGTLAATTVDVAAGTYTAAQSVTISGTAGSTIRYTTDGQDPTRSVGSTYSTPVSIAASSTLKHRQVRDLYGDGPITSTVYTINLPASGFAWTMESLTATGSGDTSATLTGATLSSAQARAGTQSLYCSGAAWQYAEFTTGATANADVDMQTGTMDLWFYNTGTWTAGTLLGRVAPNSGSGYIRVGMDSTAGRLAYTYKGSNNLVTTVYVDGATETNTWYRVTIKWAYGAETTMSIALNGGTAVTSNVTLNQITEASARIQVGNYSTTVGPAMYIDDFSVTKTW